MELKFLKAGTGDAIIISHNNKNIIIDGGNDSKYLLQEVDRIRQNKEAIDLLVITHHDDDHIKGIIDLLKHINENKYDGQFIKKVIFNSPRLTLGKIVQKPESKELSYFQAYEVEELLIKINTDWKAYTEDEPPIEFNDLKLAILSPTQSDLNKYSTQKGAYLTGDWKCDWNVSLAKLDPHINDDSQDSSISNKSSVVLKVSCDDKQILLTGDATPDRLNVIIQKLYTENGDAPVPFDVIKLPHHGSYRSVTKSLLEKVKCHKFIISTNSKKHFLPNKRAILKVLKFVKRENNQPIEFVFNYPEALQKLDITEKETVDYNFILTPNNQTYGISL